MFNAVYRLVEPRRIEIDYENIEINDKVVVKPTYLSICNADVRYYVGARSAEVLAKKLPMALIHEGIGVVVSDPQGKYKEGERVVMIPNIPTEQDDVIAENYLRTSKFRSSGVDGFMQENVAIGRDRLVKLPASIDDEVGAFIELISVAYHTILRLLNTCHQRKDCIALWGDGNLAYIVALLLKELLPSTKVVVFGKHAEKLDNFSFVDDVFDIMHIPESLEIDHAVECVGGQGSESAINQIIDVIKPEGTIAIMGVSENNVPIKTRMVLEKGLRIIGSSRSGRTDFVSTVELLSNNTEIVSRLKHIVNTVVEVNSVSDIHVAFEKDLSKRGGKTIMRWNI